MATNLDRGIVNLNLNGKDVHLRYTLRAIRDFDRYLRDEGRNLKVIEIVSNLHNDGKVNFPDAELLSEMVYFGLSHEHEHLGIKSIEDVLDLMDSEGFSYIDTAMAAIVALTYSMRKDIPERERERLGKPEAKKKAKKQ